MKSILPKLDASDRIHAVTIILKRGFRRARAATSWEASKCEYPLMPACLKARFRRKRSGRKQRRDVRLLAGCASDWSFPPQEASARLHAPRPLA
jgi:hypothetical protein